MSKKLLNSLTITSLIGIALMSFQNCSEMAFSSTEKAAALNNNPILPPSTQPPPIANPPSTPGYNNNNLVLGVTRMCSNSRTKEKNGNLSSAKTLKLQILENNVQNNNKVACSITDTAKIRSQALAGSITIPNCKLSNAGYRIEILDENGTNLIYGYGIDHFRVIDDRIMGSLQEEVIVDTNVDDDDYPDTGFPYNNSPCDKRASPLYVDFREDVNDYDILSSPEDGVKFDILGANGKPAYSKTQISWFKRGRFAMLALPNERGEVLGIDQLFGDNTFGPDEDFAANGFLALAKYDENKDNRIDESDEVYRELRLWFDYNRDGVAQRHELHALSDRGLESIDLIYDENFREVDQYGNEIKYKSVVKMKSGRLRPIFDVWFRL